VFRLFIVSLNVTGYACHGYGLSSVSLVMFIMGMNDHLLCLLEAKLWLCLLLIKIAPPLSFLVGETK
jgi:hypothetical protein